MNAITRKTTVQADGWLRVQAPPEFQNQEVDVIILPPRPPTSERVAAWQRICREIQSLPGSKDITDDDIQKEIDAYRASVVAGAFGIRSASLR